MVAIYCTAVGDRTLSLQTHLALGVLGSFIGIAGMFVSWTSGKARKFFVLWGFFIAVSIGIVLLSYMNGARL
jgi:hypothetical protein